MLYKKAAELDEREEYFYRSWTKLPLSMPGYHHSTQWKITGEENTADWPYKK